MDAAAKRADPIPVFAEMGSLNPITILASALAKDANAIADKLIASITTDAGQFCTKPGVILMQEGESTEAFFQLLTDKLAGVSPVPMLHPGIHESFGKGVAKLRELSGHEASSVSLIASQPAQPGTLQGSPHLFRTDAETFLGDETLRQEFFGPLAIFVTLSSVDQIEPVLRSLGGQLTASLFADDADAAAKELLPLLSEIAGRVIVNGVPTGVEVNSAIQHGGPWPACSDSRFSAVGPSALLRFVRPVAYQNVPGHWLPEVLR
jgi:NADP-dependent aldehyde dehydrogenase